MWALTDLPSMGLMVAIARWRGGGAGGGGREGADCAWGTRCLWVSAAQNRALYVQSVIPCCCAGACCSAAATPAVTRLHPCRCHCHCCCCLEQPRGLCNSPTAPPPAPSVQRVTNKKDSSPQPPKKYLPDKLKLTI